MEVCGILITGDQASEEVKEEDFLDEIYFQLNPMVRNAYSWVVWTMDARVLIWDSGMMECVNMQENLMQYAR